MAIMIIDDSVLVVMYYASFHLSSSVRFSMSTRFFACVSQMAKSIVMVTLLESSNIA